jgi:hypothetical protein
VRQKVAPLQTQVPITRFGAAKATAPITFNFGSASVGTGTAVPLLRTSDVKDFFAPAQFFEMDDAKKLSAKSFEEKSAGYTLSIDANDVGLGSTKVAVLDYDTIILGPAGESAPTRFDLPAAHLIAMNRKNAVALSGAVQAGTLKYLDPQQTQPFTLFDVAYVLVNSANLTSLQPNPTPLSRTDALFALDAHLADHPASRGEIQVVALHELAA